MGFLDKLPGLGSLDSLGKLAAGVVGFLAELSDPAMWRSLGWLLLGLFLIFAGVLKWLEKPLMRAGRAAITAAAVAE